MECPQVPAYECKRRKGVTILNVDLRIGRVLHDRASTFYWSGTGSTSIKSFYNGSVEYRLNSGTRTIDSNRYLLLNDHQPYTIQIDSTQQVESFCVFFAPGYIERAAMDMIGSDQWLLDNPHHPSSLHIELIDKTYWNDDIVTPKIHRLRAVYPKFRTDQIWIEEQLVDLMQSVLLLHSDVISRMNKITSSRVSTREELYRRVSIANEVILEHFREPLSLEQLSKAAMLSVNHLIRNYMQVYGVTPHQHIVTLRLMEAERLLKKSSLSVSEVCSSVGFESLGSFITIFHRKRGVSPGEFRKQIR